MSVRDSRKRPSFYLRFSHREELGCVFARPFALLDAKSEFLVRDTAVVRLGSVYWSMYFEPNVEILASKEIRLVRREHATKGRTTSETLEVLRRSGGKAASAN